VFADEPNLFPGEMLLTLIPDPLRRAIGDAHSSKPRPELFFRASSPTDGLPFGMGQRVFGRGRESVGDMPLPGTATAGNRRDHLHIGGKP
jgi:hypothetical protein